MSEKPRESWSRFLNQTRVPDFIGAQLRRPSGRFGRLVMTALLNRGNQELIVSVLSALRLQPEDHYLDVGFGGGRALMLAARRVRRGHLYGIDFSPDVVVAGQRSLRALIAEGRLDLITADVADLPLRDQLATKVSTMNTIYFWPDPSVAMQSLLRVMAPGAQLAIGFAGAEKMAGYGKVTAQGFTHYAPDEVGALVQEAGFEEVSVVALDGRRTRGDFIASGTRSVR